MGGGICTSVKGYIKKRVTLAVDDNIIEDETIANSNFPVYPAAAAAGCVDTKPQQQEPSSFPEISNTTSLGASSSVVPYMSFSEDSSHEGSDVDLGDDLEGDWATFNFFLNNNI